MPQITFSDLTGKTVLVSITQYAFDNVLIDRKQFSGQIIEAGERGIVIRQKNGETIPLPPDLSAIQPAQPGAYRSPVTGETVVDPDFLISWSVHMRKPE